MLLCITDCITATACPDCILAYNGLAERSAPPGQASCNHETGEKICLCCRCCGDMEHLDMSVWAFEKVRLLHLLRQCSRTRNTWSSCGADDHSGFAHSTMPSPPSTVPLSRPQCLRFLLQLADKKWGVIGIQYRPVPCKYTPDVIAPPPAYPSPGQAPPSGARKINRGWDWTDLGDSSSTLLHLCLGVLSCLRVAVTLVQVQHVCE